ncbi:glucose-1-phosphate adenylyltransferase [Bifidobacterium bifidum]|nr:glucose-1-phosphate adenylyltransferase [Bifidobacterium bifidum]
MAKNKQKILSIVLAGGEGTRLMPLTRDRAKPAVPFGGVFRLIDFPLSNLVNSDYRHIIVLTQYKSHSLDRHISQMWRFSSLLGNYVSPVPAQQRLGKHWYLGSADAIYQTINIIEDVQPDIVVIVGADHVYRMDFGQMVEQHIESGAEFTVAGIRQPLEESNQFGVINVDPNHPNMIREFQEKPATTEGLPDDPNSFLASMGNYVANTDALFDALAKDEKAADTKHDMGGDIAPYFASRGEAGVYDFNSNVIPGSTPTDHAYWRDVGTIKQFYDAHMDLIAYVPEFNLYNQAWPIYTNSGTLPPAKFVHAGRDRLGHATDSIVSPRRHRLGRRGASFRAVAERAHPFVGPGGRLRAVRRRHRQPSRPRVQGDSRQERCADRELHGRHRHREGPRPRLHRDAGRHHRRAEGHHRGRLIGSDIR